MIRKVSLSITINSFPHNLLPHQIKYDCQKHLYPKHKEFREWLIIFFTTDCLIKSRLLH